MRIAIPSLNFCGGAETVALTLARLLSKSYDVKIITADKPNWDKIARILNFKMDIKHEYKLDYDVTSNLTPINMFKLVLAYKKMLEKESNDPLINMYGDLDIFINKGDIVYTGMPFSIIEKSNRPLYLNNIMHKIYTLITKLKHTNKNIIISNSFYTKQIIKDRLNLETQVIHPPPTIDKIVSISKDDIVLTISRIVRGKKLERVLEIASALPNIKFVIVGRLYDEAYYKELLNKSMHLNNLIFVINEPKHVMIDYLARSRILLHTMDNETYGLAIVESMLARCIPVVPRNGGPWIDILDKRDGLYGYSYDNINEAIDIIKMLINGNELIAENAYKRASSLSKEFYQEFPKVIKSL